MAWTRYKQRGQTKTKQQDLKDITEECGAGGIFSKNYVNDQHKILSGLRFINPTISIDTNKY